jgi:hypothetical protein
MALYDTARIPSLMVVRPSGIWNARAPFHTFLKVYKGQQRSYDMSTLCLESVSWGLPVARKDGRPLKEYLVVSDSNRSKRAWKSYAEAQVDRKPDGTLWEPIYGNARNDVKMAYEVLKETIVISSYALFERYVNCWLLNYLLWKLESGLNWDSTESGFAKLISPINGSKSSPNLAKIMSAVPALKHALCKLDHNGWEIPPDSAVSPQFTGFDAITFWRHYRNCSVHNGGFCTPRFFAQQEQYWQHCLRPRFLRDEFKSRKPLPLSSELLRHCRLTVYRCARALELSLEAMSAGRRGHPWAPAPRPTESTSPPKDSPPLLMAGDHELSLRWHTDEEFREQFRLTV